ncbi:MAG: filamentous hemagglutinin, partial [Microcoleus sp. T3-bin5]|nr:filamentous hemagglutinin [Microcoleus sp. T3-bin5]
VPNATMTYVDGNSSIAANATGSGNGGRVFVWADNTTAFLGSISAKGVSATDTAGVGGFVEVSGKQRLIFKGTVDTDGTNGLGTLLLDPENILITDSAEGTGDAAIIANNNILATGTLPGQQNNSEPSLTISALALESMSATSNVVLEALNNITIADLADNQLSFQATTGSVTLRADADRSGAGVFSMNAVDTISTAGGSIAISGNQITAGNLSSNGGNISLISPGSTVANNISSSNPKTGSSGNILLEGLNVTVQKLDASGPEAAGNVTVTAQNVLGVSFVAGGSGNITLTGNEINFKGDKNSVSGTGFLVLQPWSPGQNIAIGGSGDVGTNIYLNLTAKDLGSLQNGFAGITIGRSNGMGSILIANDLTFYDSLIIQSPAGLGTITTTSSLTGADNASITLKAEGNIRTGNISTNGEEIRLASTTGNVTTGQLLTVGTRTINTNVNSSQDMRNSAGDVTVTAED